MFFFVVLFFPFHLLVLVLEKTLLSPFSISDHQPFYMLHSSLEMKSKWVQILHMYLNFKVLKNIVIFSLAMLVASVMAHQLKCASELIELIFFQLRQIIHLLMIQKQSHLQSGGKIYDRVREPPQGISSLGVTLPVLGITFLVSALSEYNQRVSCLVLPSRSVCLTLCDPARLLCPWNSPGKNTAVGSHSLLQGIFPTQGLNLGHELQADYLPSEPPWKPPASVISGMVMMSFSYCGLSWGSFQNIVFGGIS